MLLVHVRYSKLSWNPRWQVFHYPEAKGEREKGGGENLLIVSKEIILKNMNSK